MHCWILIYFGMAEQNNWKCSKIVSSKPTRTLIFVHFIHKTFVSLCEGVWTNPICFENLSGWPQIGLSKLDEINRYSSETLLVFDYIFDLKWAFNNNRMKKKSTTDCCDMFSSFWCEHWLEHGAEKPKRNGSVRTFVTYRFRKYTRSEISSHLCAVSILQSKTSSVMVFLFQITTIEMFCFPVEFSVCFYDP